MGYVAPELTVINFEAQDVITNSQLAVSKGDNNVSVDKNWWD